MSITRLAETMVRREYSKKNINLPNKFWNLPEYKPSYQLQMRHAAKLYRTYSEKAIWAVINREAWIFSLGLKKLSNMIEIEESKIKTAESKPEKIEQEVDSSVPVFRVNKGGSIFDE
jgi:hypothetical protein